MVVAIVFGGDVMKKITYATLILAAAVGAVVFSGSGNAQNRRVLADAEAVTGDRFRFTARTPMGANVYAVNRPTARVLRAIDTGLGELFAVANRHNYRRRLNYSDYSIYIAKPDRTKDSQGQYSSDFAVNAGGGYAGSVYDQGGFVYAAGMVIANDPCSFIIAEHTRDFGRVSNTVRYEGEHIVLFHNDRRKYAATADHSRGGGHPILQ